MIVIPMAGASSRFYKAGYTKPKYMLVAHGETLFSHSVKSFKSYFSSENFLFILNKNDGAETFVRAECKTLGIQDFQIVELDSITRGQAETVMLGMLPVLNDNKDLFTSPITIFNIDTFRINFSFPDLNNFGDGYLEVFCGAGSNWSYVRAKNSSDTVIAETAEKRPISDLCCTGLYHFASAELFIQAFQNYLSLPVDEWEKGELYIAPMYNKLIQLGFNIHYHLIDSEDVIFCGTPDEYTIFLGS